MYIEKFKYDWENKKTKISWKSSNKDEANKFSIEIKMDIPDNLKMILLELRDYVNDVCELNIQPEQISMLKVTGISLSWTKNVMGVTVTALKELNFSNAPLVINTPHKTEMPYSETGDATNLIDDKYLKIFYEMIGQIKNLINSEPMQLELFPKEELIK